MKINKHIEGLAVEAGFDSEWAHQLLQYMWNNRNKPQLFVATIPNVSKSGMSRDVKVGLIYNRSFVDVTRLVAEITENKINKDTHSIKMTGCGMDMVFALLESLYSRLSAKKSNVQAHRFNAVQSYVFF